MWRRGASWPRHSRPRLWLLQPVRMTRLPSGVFVHLSICYLLSVQGLECQLEVPKRRSNEALPSRGPKLLSLNPRAENEGSDKGDGCSQAYRRNLSRSDSSDTHKHAENRGCRRILNTQLEDMSKAHRTTFFKDHCLASKLHTNNSECTLLHTWRGKRH